MKSRKERNKSVKQRKRCITPKDGTDSNTPIPEPPPVKHIKKTNSKQYKSNKLSYTIRGKKETPATNCTSPVHIGKTDKYFENLTYSFVKASVCDNPTKATPTGIPRFPSTSSCGRCNPQYYMCYDKSDGNVYREKSRSYSWYGESILYSC